MSVEAVLGLALLVYGVRVRGVGRSGVRVRVVNMSVRVRVVSIWVLGSLVSGCYGR